LPQKNTKNSKKNRSVDGINGILTGRHESMKYVKKAGGV
jgi:hypothetical protein